MAQYYWDFTALSRTHPEQLWSGVYAIQGTPAYFDIFVDADPISGNSVRNSLEAGESVAFFETDNDLYANKSDIVARVILTGLSSYPNPITTNISVSGFYAVAQSATNIYIRRGANTIASTALAASINTEYWYRLQIDTGANTLKAKRWTGARSDEPVAWNIETTDSSSPLPNGKLGFAYSGDIFYTRELAIGTNGDPPPTGQVPAKYKPVPTNALYVSQRLLREPRLLVPGMQPVGNVKVDWSNPITRKLIFCFYPPHYVNLADNGAAVITNASPVVAANTGLQWAGHAGTTRVDWPSKTRVTGTDFSWFSRGNYYNGAAFAEEIVFANFNTFGNAFYSYVNWTAGKASLSARYNVIASGSAIHNETISVGETLLSGVTNGCKAWFNGKISNTSTSTISALSANAYTTSFGFYPSASWLNRHPAGMNTEVCYAWDRALNDSEMVALHADPYQFLIPA